jgi:citrate lyase gamma subunit
VKQLDSQLYSQLDSQLDSQLGSQLRSQIDSQLYSQLDSQLDSQLGSQLGSQLRSQIDSQLDSQLDLQLRSQLYSQLGSQLRSQLDSQLYSQLGSQLGSQQLTYIDNTALLWYWGGYYCFYDYILNELHPTKKDDFRIFQAFTEWLSKINWIIPLSGVCIVIQNPKQIKFNADKLLHNADGPAVEYPDGYSLYAYNGTVGNNLMDATLNAKLDNEVKDE